MKIKKWYMISSILFLGVMSCTKSDSINNIDSGNIDSVLLDSILLDSITSSKNLISFKTGEWKVYPYFGGPGEDSMYSSWSPEISLSVIRIYSQVFIKEKNGKVLLAPQFISVSQMDSGYLFQPGLSLGVPNKILLWWIQKVPGSKPDADSCFISY